MCMVWQYGPSHLCFEARFQLLELRRPAKIVTRPIPGRIPITFRHAMRGLGCWYKTYLGLSACFVRAATNSCLHFMKTRTTTCATLPLLR